MIPLENFKGRWEFYENFRATTTLQTHEAFKSIFLAVDALADLVTSMNREMAKIQIDLEKSQTKKGAADAKSYIGVARMHAASLGKTAEYLTNS